MERENDLIFYTLVPHTTHEVQPLDVVAFKSLNALGKRSTTIMCSHTLVELL